MQLGMPVQYKLKDGFIHVLPGDDLYPEKPNYNDWWDLFYKILFEKKTDFTSTVQDWSQNAATFDGNLFF